MELPFDAENLKIAGDDILVDIAVTAGRNWLDAVFENSRFEAVCLSSMFVGRANAAILSPFQFFLRRGC
jgi:hypothetical protein